MRIDLYNNLAISTLAIHAVVFESKKLEVSKSLLIMPFFAHTPLTGYLANRKTEIKSIEHLMAKKIEYFSNFDKRYYDNLLTSFYALQILQESGIFDVNDGFLICKQSFELDKKMGRRVEKMIKATPNLVKLLQDDATKIYLNLRVTL